MAATCVTNEDWETLLAIYGHDEDYDCGAGFDDDGENNNNNERRLKLVASPFPQGFCGTVYMTLSTSKIAFARLVKSDGSYRYFCLSKPPILKLDLLYRSKNTSNKVFENDQEQYDFDDESETSMSEGPSNLRLAWEYYPSEWPTQDQEPYRSSLAQKCHMILKEEGSFSVCQFLEHDAISFYYQSNCQTTVASESIENVTCNATSNSWKTYSDSNHPDYLLVILPPQMDQLYYSSPGILLHPREEASRLQKAADEKKQIATNSKTKRKSSTTTKKKASSIIITSTLDFGRHSLLENWKDLYTTRCPICLEESMLYSDGVILPYCQHYCCLDCFTMYLRFKVDDIQQHRTNPFLCPVESCKRELPMAFCKPFLTEENIKAAKAWYKDLKRPPAWSLDRCLRTKTCGAIGSMRRKKGVDSIEATAVAANSATKRSREQQDLLKWQSKNLENIVYCESCKVMWCELCLVRVYDDFECQPATTQPKKLQQTKTAREIHTISNHRYHCRPQSILRFCRKYRKASDELKRACEAKYPWIASYSQFCENDGAALQYIRENAQTCPSCKTGIERSEGCFHMKCPTCATHFCYECGQELFPPYYGTHHCWEEEQPTTAAAAVGGGQDNYFNMDEQLAMALQYAD